MKDNLSYMTDFRPLNLGEQEAVRKAQEAINGIHSIPCTACHYCTAGCPKQIPIPEIFAARNKQLVWGQLEEGKADYIKAVAGVGTALDCIACRQCEKACPQQIKVIENLFGLCCSDVHWTSSTINRCSTRYSGVFRLADRN